MRAVMLHAPGHIRVEDIERPTLVEPTDAIIRVTAACICGSDLWPYRGAEDVHGPSAMGHETSAWSKKSATTCATSRSATSWSAPS